MEQWDDILRTHGPLVWQTVWRLLRHEADAADAFQETFVSAVRVARRETVGAAKRDIFVMLMA